jgi:two-component system, cell cycle sensor histidine kinase PleC
VSQNNVRELLSSASASASAKAGARLKWTVFAVLLLLTGGLLLKAWDEHQRDDLALLGALDGDVRAIAARIDGRADTAEVAIRLIAEGTLTRTVASTAIPHVDTVVSLTDAAQSPPGSRLAEASIRADELIKAGGRIGLTSQGDIVLVVQPKGQPAQMAMAPIGSWLPAQGAGSYLTIADGRHRAGVGDSTLQAAGASADRQQPAMQSLGGLRRAASACSALVGGDMSVCRTLSRPVFALADLIRLLIFGLLIAAPVLAVLGLLGKVSVESTAEIIEETRENEADRIMGLVMRGARAGYWEWKDDEGMFISEGAAALFGMEGTGLVDLSTLIHQVHPEHQKRMQETLANARSIGWVQTTFPTSYVPQRWIEIRGSLTDDANGNATVFGGIVLDITERKQQEDRVKAAERRLRAAIEGFDGPFALWDHRRRLLYWNRAFAIDFEMTDTLRAGMSHETVVIARAGAVKLEKQSSEDRRTTLIALQKGRWLKMVERETSDGGLITVGVDVTENVRIEEELRRQREGMKRAVTELERSEGRASVMSRKYSEEKTKAEHAAHTKSAFLANMSHELRTPLNAINGFSEILANELYGALGDQRYKGYAQDILTSGQHLLDMINDILDMAKIEAGKMTISPQPIDPVDPVDAAVRMIRRKAEDKQIALLLDAQQGLPDIEADHRAIRQMVLNLVSNAIKFTDPGGTITVRVEQRGPEIYVGVIDTGIGIPPEDLPRLANPFEQVSGSRDRNTEGTGLGLALTKSFAEMHGGRMSISSIYGEGTTVGFTLPIDGRDSLNIDDYERDVA